MKSRTTKLLGTMRQSKIFGDWWVWLGLGVFVIVASVLLFRSRAGSLTIVHPPTTIATDCSVDVSSAFNTWIASLGNDTVIELAPDACYKTDDEIQIFDKTNFFIHGNNATFRRTLKQGSFTKGNHLHVHLARDTNIGINNLNITGVKTDQEGYNSGLEAQHGFGMWALNQGVFDNVNIQDIYGDCFYFNGGPENGFTRFVTVKNSFCHQTGRHGAAFLATNDILITHSTFELNHRENFDFEPYGTGRGGANNITIDNNVIGEASQLLISAASGSPELHNLVFSNNIVHRRFSIDIENATKNGPRGPVTITNNMSDKPSHGSPITIRGVSHVLIAGNKVLMDGVDNSGAPNGTLVRLYYGHDVRVFNNIASVAKSILDVDNFSDTYCERGNTPALNVNPVCNKNDMLEAENAMPRAGAHLQFDNSASHGQVLQFAPAP